MTLAEIWRIMPRICDFVSSVRLTEPSTISILYGVSYLTQRPLSLFFSLNSSELLSSVFAASISNCHRSIVSPVSFDFMTSTTLFSLFSRNHTSRHSVVTFSHWYWRVRTSNLINDLFNVSPQFAIARNNQGQSIFLCYRKLFSGIKASLKQDALTQTE